MHSEPIQTTDSLTALSGHRLAATQNPRAGEPAHAAEPQRPTPIGLLNLGVAWLFGLEALLAEPPRRQ